MPCVLWFEVQEILFNFKANSSVWDFSLRVLEHGSSSYPCHSTISGTFLNLTSKDEIVWYLFTKSSFLVNDSRIGAKPYMFLLNKIESVDIDDPEDFIIAESLHKIFR